MSDADSVPVPGRVATPSAAPARSAGRVRAIRAAAPPARFARGWHCLGLAGRFRADGPHAVQVFGTKLAVFADSAGTLHVLDGYCRHMGGDLTRGTVKADAIACPFHDWRWGGDGRCELIPYSRRELPGGDPQAAARPVRRPGRQGGRQVRRFIGLGFR
jgi:phenylpropionate dioxygenase-like ring-hydroxylating dioxygenase large terminal subunit